MRFKTTNRKFSYSDGFKDAKFIFGEYGIWNFWRGNSANVLRVFPFSAINFAVFDMAR